MSTRRSAAARRLLRIASAISLLGSLFFWFLYFSLYWPYRNLFDGQGRYFDDRSAIVHHEQSGLLAVPALGLLLLAAFSGWLSRRRTSVPGGA